MRVLRDEGVAILFVSHFLDQVYEISDRMTVLRNGRLVGEYLTADLTQLQLVSAMIGRELRGAGGGRAPGRARSPPTRPAPAGARGARAGPQGRVEPFDLDIHAR